MIMIHWKGVVLLKAVTGCHMLSISMQGFMGRIQIGTAPWVEETLKVSCHPS